MTKAEIVKNTKAECEKLIAENKMIQCHNLVVTTICYDLGIRSKEGKELKNWFENIKKTA